MTRASVVVSILLAACASQPRHATLVSVPRATHDTLRLLPSACRQAGDTTAATRDTIYTIGVGVQPTRPPGSAQECRAFLPAASPLVFELTLPAGHDLRDALDGGVGGSPQPDVVVTSDPDVLAYAVRSSAFFVDTLPWNTLYVLISDGSDTAWAYPSAAERDALARDAVTAASRGAVEPFTWLTSLLCTDMPGAPQPQRLPIVAYAPGDPVAKQLAERIVALAASRSRPRWIPREVPAGARVARADSLAASALRPAALVRTLPVERPRCGVAPLVETRAHVIVRRGSGAAFLVGRDGSLAFLKRSAP